MLCFALMGFGYLPQSTQVTNSNGDVVLIYAKIKPSQTMSMGTVSYATFTESTDDTSTDISINGYNTANNPSTIEGLPVVEIGEETFYEIKLIFVKGIGL